MPESKMVPEELCAERHKRILEEQKEIKAKIEDLSKIWASIERITQQILNMQIMVTKNDTRLNELEAKPGKKLDAIVMSIVTGIVGVVIGFLAFRMGLK